MLVCRKHVKDALKNFDVPHVSKLNHVKCTCSICSQNAEVKIFYSIPYSRKKENQPKYAKI